MRRQIPTVHLQITFLSVHCKTLLQGENFEKSTAWIFSSRAHQPLEKKTQENQKHNWEQDIMLNIAYLTQLLFHSKELEAVLDMKNESDLRGCWEWKRDKGPQS